MSTGKLSPATGVSINWGSIPPLSQAELRAVARCVAAAADRGLDAPQDVLNADVAQLPETLGRRSLTIGDCTNLLLAVARGDVPVVDRGAVRTPDDAFDAIAPLGTQALEVAVVVTALEDQAPLDWDPTATEEEKTDARYWRAVGFESLATNFHRAIKAAQEVAAIRFLVEQRKGLVAESAAKISITAFGERS